MKLLTSPTWIKVKGILFLFLGLLSAALVYSEHPTLQVVLFLALAVWSFCRFYYFAFYVMERYVDPSYRFSGRFSLARYLIRTRPNPVALQCANKNRTSAIPNANANP
jgi:hypothetical protein